MLEIKLQVNFIKRKAKKYQILNKTTFENLIF